MAGVELKAIGSGPPWSMQERFRFSLPGTLATYVTVNDAAGSIRVDLAAPKTAGIQLWSDGLDYYPCPSEVECPNLSYGRSIGDALEGWVQLDLKGGPGGPPVRGGLCLELRPVAADRAFNEIRLYVNERDFQGPK